VAVKWGIVHGKGRNYFVEWTNIGPWFGGNKNTAATFDTKREAEREINLFPVVASVMCNAVKMPPMKKRTKR
jgi:hypothetical protein